MDQSSSPQVSRPAFTRIFESPLFWIATILIAFGLPLGRSFLRKPVAAPAVLGRLQPFHLIDQDNQPVTLDSLRGEVLVVNFIFTSCPDVCPLLTAQMAKIQNRMKGAGPEVKLLSISVDPLTDTPAVLKAYGEKYNASFSRWSFLTGPLDAIERVVVNGFKVALEQSGKADQKIDQPTLMDITHGQHFVIVDQIGQIRKYSQANNEDEINDIVRTVAILLNLPPTNVGPTPVKAR